jgi:flagellar hook assembly protein FlgD
LDANFFNPNNVHLGMDVRVDVAGQVKIMVFNIVGETVATLLNQYESAGQYRVYWDGKNRYGEMAGNAVYFVLIQEPSGQMVRKVIVLK